MNWLILVSANRGPVEKTTVESSRFPYMAVRKSIQHYLGGGLYHTLSEPDVVVVEVRKVK